MKPTYREKNLLDYLFGGFRSTLNSLGCTLYLLQKHHFAHCSPPPRQREFVCGACTGTAQVGVSLVAPLDSIFKLSSLNCLSVYFTWFLWHKKCHACGMLNTHTPPYPSCLNGLGCIVWVYVWRAICDISKFHDGTHMQGLNTTQARHHTHVDLSTCRACSVKHMMIMRQYLPRLVYLLCLSSLKYDDDVSTIPPNPVRDSGLSH